MSLQDDIFDIEAALEGKPEADLFSRFVKRFGELEQRLDSPPQEVEYSEVNFHYLGSPPDLMHRSIEQKLEKGWRIIQMISWPATGMDAHNTYHWKVIFGRQMR